MSARQYTDQLQKLDTPFYFYDMQLLADTLAKAVAEARKIRLQSALCAEGEFRPAYRCRDPQSRIGSRLCEWKRSTAGHRERPAPASEIVFAGVAKSDKEIRYALGQDIFSFNCESLQELEVINALAAETGRTARIALRINPDVDPRTHKHISTGQADSKFGISYTEINEAIRSLNRLPNIRIVGIHFHIGSQITDMEVFGNFCVKVNKIQQWFVEQGIE